MARRRSKLRLMSLVLVGAGIIPLLSLGEADVSAKQEVGIDTFTISSSRNDQIHPRISGDRVVWQDYRNIGPHTTDDVNADISYYDFKTRDDFVVSDGHTASHPDISGETIVFTDGRNGDKDIRAYNVRTDSYFWVIKRAGSDQDRAAIDGNLVVWQDNRDGNWDIRGENIDTGDEFWVSHRDSNQTNPRISGHKVVWQDDRDGCCDIYLKDLDSGTVTRVTDSNDASEPDIDGDTIVYHGGDRSDRANIYAYSISTGQTIRLNSERSDVRGQPSVDGRFVVWADRRNGEDYNIFGYDLTAKFEFLIARGGNDQQEPAVSGSRVVWTDQRGDRGADIRGATLTPQAQATATPSPTPAPTTPPVGVPPVGPPVQQGPCTFVLGFQFLHDRILEAEGNIVGQCQENEWHNPDNGDGLQRTSGRGDGAIGMFVWRKADNWTAYTDGFTTWLWGPCGLQKRLNSGPFFNWEGHPGAACS